MRRCFILKNKNNSERSSKIKRQLVSTGLYIALAATVVLITSNSVKKILGGTGYEIPDTNPKELVLPELDTLPEQTKHEYPMPDTTVSEAPEGISAEVTEPVGEAEIGNETPVTVQPQEYSEVSGEPDDDSEQPQLPDVNGKDIPSVRVKPVAGYISREFSADELLYTPTMNDFRTHDGIDIAADIGSPVCAFADGIVADVYNDPFMGTTVVIKHSGGLVSSYSNLSSELPQGITVGAAVKVGDTIGGVGETAIVESAEVPHVHFEIYKDELCVNPEDYLI